MKTKKNEQTLVLKKITVSDLEEKELNSVKGGITALSCPGPCPTIDGKTCW